MVSGNQWSVNAPDWIPLKLSSEPEFPLLADTNGDISFSFVRQYRQKIRSYGSFSLKKTDGLLYFSNIIAALVIFMRRDRYCWNCLLKGR
ncbi:hypothetical protein CDAR_61861 [Caerostris darwini]|uniref:Uncharacterized protein n=1 Tax=Caerostris darwini TaxID=1538125 RepID=A0AAV4VJS2_9ARAC|nr:hypothetical protein CDAR_61861 [Caerostris darwini]